MEDIAKIIIPERVIPAAVEFVDIAVLVKGESKGEGLGNQFFVHIRQVNAIVHVVRCFEDQDVVHVEGRIDPIEDIETINMELALADLEVVEKRIGNISRLLKSNNKEIVKNAISFLKKGGKFYYITCSIFKEENEEVRDWILANTDLKMVEEIAFDGIRQKADGMYMVSFTI